MARIEFTRLAHSYLSGSRSGFGSRFGFGPRPGASATVNYALQPMDQVWEDGGAYALLGPSGCGKTTLLNIISGLIRPSEGKVAFNSIDVTAQSTEQRNIAQVFQFPVIYDTMTVFDNLAFPLRNRRIAEPEVRARVQQVAEMLDLTADLKHRASGLAADAKQKISLGRGLVRKDVAAILFDEPLTVIDPHLKWTLRRKLKQIHQEFKLTLIYVTHDQTEALTFADRVVVMYEGRIVQAGTPQELFEDPAHVFVGHFIGSPGMNLLPCRVDGGNALVDGQAIALAPERAARARGASGELQLGIRPEFVALTATAQPGALAATVRTVEDLGNRKIVTVGLGDRLLKVRIDEDEPLNTGPAWISFPKQWTRLYANGSAV